MLIVVHQERSDPGHVGRWFRRRGHRLDIRRPYDGEPLPRSLAGHCGAIILGGPQSANDDFAYIRREIDWIGVPLAEQKPYLGICLGAQMLARHLGARVDHCAMGSVEIGYHPLLPTIPGNTFGFPRLAYQWHREGFDLPSGATRLATGGNAYPNQAIAVGRTAVGVQFHPEITFAQVSGWSANPVRLLLRGAKPRQQQIEDHLVHAAAMHRWLDAFLQHWVAGRLPLP